MNLSAVCIFLSVVVLANCQGDKSVFLAIENYLTGSGKELRANCIRENGITEELVDKAEQTAKVPEDKNFKCFLRCTFRASKLIDENGVMNMDILKSLLKATNPVFIGKVEKNCKQPTSDDLCESAATSCICFLTMAHEEHIHV